MYETILIVGAGPTGLTLGICLARRGIPCRVVDGAPAPFTGSRGKGLQPRTLEVFDDLGVIEAFLAAGALYPKFRVHLGPWSLRAGSLGTSKAPSEAVPYPNLWMVPQFRTEAILRERLRALGVEVEFAAALEGFTQNENGVTATLANGEIVRAAYLVGCDGGKSTVRKALGLALQGEAVDEKPVMVADVEMNGLSRDAWHVWPFRRGGLITFCPLPHTPLFQFTGPADFDLAAHVDRVAWSSIYRPSVRMVDRYRVGRVFLAGDAAHLHPPAGGQGLNTGVQDAYNLGWKLGGSDALLDTYEAERLPIAAAVLGLSKRLHRTRSIKRGDATNQLALHYRDSSLSSGVAHRDLHPGDRMPDRRLGDGTRLFDRLRGPHGTEVDFDDARVRIRPDGYIENIARHAMSGAEGGPHLG